MAVVLEARSLVMIGQRLSDAPGTCEAVVALVRKVVADTAPHARPLRIRTSEPRLAQAIRDAKLDIAIHFAPTPEMNEVGTSLAQFFTARAASPVDVPRDAASMHGLFTAARAMVGGALAHPVRFGSRPRRRPRARRPGRLPVGDRKRGEELRVFAVSISAIF